MNILRKARHILVTGRSGQGKTSYAERYIAGSHHAKVFIFDWQSEFAPRLGLPLTTDVDSEARVICYDPHVSFPGQMAEAFEAFCQYVFEQAQNFSPRETLLVCDELQRVIPIQDPPQGFRTVLQTGRRASLDTLILSQQPNRLHNEVREQFTEIIYFRLGDSRSLDFVADRGVNAERIAELPALHYLWTNTQTDESRPGVIRF